MRTSRSLMGLWLTGLYVLLGASAGWAADFAPWTLGDLALFFDPAGTVRSKLIPTGSTFDVYLVARIPEGGISSYDLVEPNGFGEMSKEP